MSRTRPPRARSSALPVGVLVSVLAVLALAVAPGLAQAREASELQYEPEVPTVPSETNTGGGTHSGGSGGGNGGGNAGISNSPEGNGSGSGSGQGAGGGSHTGQSNQAPNAESGKPGSGSGGAGGKVGPGQEVKPGDNSAGSPGDESSSSPLAPILIAIVVLAAISIGAYYYRQRRQGAGSSVSPKAS